MHPEKENIIVIIIKILNITVIIFFINYLLLL